MRQEERLKKTSEITSTLLKAKQEGIEIDEKKLTLQCCARWGISMRTAKEYLEVAKCQIQ